MIQVSKYQLKDGPIDQSITTPESAIIIWIGYIGTMLCAFIRNNDLFNKNTKVVSLRFVMENDKYDVSSFEFIGCFRSKDGLSIVSAYRL